MIIQSQLLKTKSQILSNLFNEKYGLRLGEFENTTGTERVKNYAGNFVTIWESFQVMLPGGRAVVAFCERILALGTNTQGFTGVNPPAWPLISALYVVSKIKIKLD